MAQQLISLKLISIAILKITISLELTVIFKIGGYNREWLPIKIPIKNTLGT